MPEISIGICCYNEEANIANLLENLLTRQSLPLDSEILVVCSGCTDTTVQIVSEYVDRDPRVALIVEDKRRGKASALNRILERYRGAYLILIPGDVLPAHNCLPLLLNTLMSSGDTGVVCGKAVPVNKEDGFIGYLSHLMWRMHHRTLSYLDRLALNTHATGELMAMKRIVTKIPHDVVNEDAYIGLVAVSKKLRARYCDDAIVYLRAPSSLVDFVKQRRRVILGHYRVRALTGRFSRTLEFMIAFDPRQTVRIVANEIHNYPHEIGRFVLAVGIEVVANILAVADLLFHREHVLWSRVDSTKGKVSW